MYKMKGEDDRVKRAGRFLANGLMLSAVALLLRTVGVSFNAFLTAKMGATGTGLYQLVLSVYSPALTLATSGVNLAVSRLVAEELGKEGGIARTVLSRCLCYAAVVSTLVGTILFLLSEVAAKSWLSAPEATPLLRVLALGLPFIALSSAINGYFTAVRRVSRTAFIQLLEQGVRIGLTVLLLARLWDGGTASCLLAVVTASVGADLISCLLLALFCHRDAARALLLSPRKEEGVLSRVLAITLPVSFSSFLRSGLVALEHLLIPRGLKQSGFSYEAAMASYGTLSGMAMPVILFPASFLYSFAGLLIPELAEAKENSRTGEIARMAERVVKTVLIYGIGAAGLLLGFSRELGLAIYQSEEAARYIRVMAPLIPIMYLDTAVDSILKGLGQQVYTMKVNIIDAFVSVLAVWFLVPRLGLNGYIVVIFISELINFSFSFTRMIAVAGAKGIFFRRIPLPVLAVTGAVSGVKLLSHVLSFSEGPAITASVGIALAAMLYVILLLLFGVIPPRRVWCLVQKLCLALPRRAAEGHNR